MKDELKPVFDQIINIDDPQFESKLADALDLTEGEPIELILPQFNRTDG
jgi:hypothetical protein